ncbi:MAG: ComEA family DNA-binding protein, partial [Chitinophagales bacterium]
MILIGMILFLLIFPWVYPYFKHDEVVDFSKFKREIDSFNSQEISDNDSSEGAPSLEELDREANSSKAKESKTQLFTFDPNTATGEDFRKLGMNDRLIKTILNYRSKGGKFFEADDFRKIYGLKEEDFQRLKPYIQIVSVAEKSPAQSQNQIDKPSTKENPVLIEINKADSADLVSLRGIGEVLSSRIIKYR